MNKSETPASLTLIDDKGQTLETWELKGKRTYYIGRGKTNDIPLPRSWISRQHAMIQMEENGLFNIMDLGSSNGTMVNGQRQHTSTRLHSGDKLQIGSTATTLVFLHDYTPATVEETDELDEETVAVLQTELVTIMVCDIREFTRLSENISPELVSSLLALWSKQVNKIIEAHNGSIDKFIGDAVMATWVGRDHLRRNIHQALASIMAIQKYTQKLHQTLTDLPWPLKVGGAVNTGEAVMGNIGVDGGRDYTVVGDVVNVTFRLEELTTKIGKDILLGIDAGHLLSSGAERYFKRYQYTVKGKQEPVDAFGCDFPQLGGYLKSVTRR